MVRLIGFIAVTFMLVMVACNGEAKLSATEEIENNVRNYFFLADSVSVDIEITDTLYSDELEELMGTIDQNLNLIEQDLDTLSLMIDDQSYQKLAFEEKLEKTILIGKNKYKDSLQLASTTLLEYRLKQSLLNNKREGFKQTNRVLMHLQRSIWANVAGYYVNARYESEGTPFNLDLLLDANHVIVD